MKDSSRERGGGDQTSTTTAHVCRLSRITRLQHSEREAKLSGANSLSWGDRVARICRVDTGEKIAAQKCGDLSGILPQVFSRIDSWGWGNGSRLEKKTSERIREQYKGFTQSWDSVCSHQPAMLENLVSRWVLGTILKRAWSRESNCFLVLGVSEQSSEDLQKYQNLQHPTR